MLTRPPSPVPFTRLRSTLCSRAIRRTRGEDRTFAVSPGDGVAGAAAGAGLAGVFGFAAAGRSGAGVSTAVPSPSINAKTALTSTVSFSFTMIFVRTPEAGEGISASTLSVEISRRGSSRSTRSPTFFSHFVTVPSAMLSPICGMMTLVGIDHSPVGRFSGHAALRFATSGKWSVASGKRIIRDFIPLPQAFCAVNPAFCSARS